MRLAWRFGCEDVDAMLNRMSAGQFAEWRAYLNIVGTDDWKQAATIAQVVQSIGAGLAGTDVAAAESFIPLYRDPGEENEAESSLTAMGSALERMATNSGNAWQFGS